MTELRPGSENLNHWMIIIEVEVIGRDEKNLE